MDALTLAMIKKYCGGSEADAKQYADEKLIEAKGYADQKAAEEAGAVDEHVSIVDMDKSTAFSLLLNAFRQHVWEWEAQEGIICEVGTKTLTNSLQFPFNNSQESVALVNTQRDVNYAVIAEITSSNGNAGEVFATDKQVNGFKLKYTGSASSAVVTYIVIGGLFT